MTKVTWQELEAAELIPFKNMQPGDIVIPMNWTVESVEVMHTETLVKFSDTSGTFERTFALDQGAEVVRRGVAGVWKS